jgi:outer membrane protein OmpA-like peptidoglycan-associated protein
MLAVALAGLATSATALADNVVVTSTGVTLAKATGSPTALTGVSVSGYSNPNEKLLVSVSTTLGSLSLPSHSGLTLSYGYTYSGAELSFVGNQANVQTALATLTLTGNGTTGTAKVSMQVTTEEPGISYLPATGHYYKYVAAAHGTWESAKTGAEGQPTSHGQPGYLASIPSETVNNFIEAHLEGAENVWVGGESTDYPSGYNSNTGIKRVWSWRAGPLNGTIFTECSNVSETCALVDNTGLLQFHDWNPSEPNNSGYPEAAGEHYLEINYQGLGKWNDLKNADPGTTGYLVEFGNLEHGGNFTGVYSTHPGEGEVKLANAPSPPTSVTGSGNSFAGHSATVSWSAPENNGNSPITKYTVTSSPSSAGCTSTTLTKCTISGLTNGTYYEFAVTATNEMGTGAASEESEAVTVSAAPATASGASAVRGAEQATVSWTAAPNNGSAITSYTVAAAPGGATCATLGATSCVVAGLTNGTSYAFTVTATNVNGSGEPSSASNAVIPSSVPNAPSGVSAVSGVREATISWTAPSGNGSAITRYTVTAAPGGQTCTSAAATSCTITRLDAGTADTFTVTATNANGASGSSSSSNAVTPVEPAAPVTPAKQAPPASGVSGAVNTAPVIVGHDGSASHAKAAPGTRFTKSYEHSHAGIDAPSVDTLSRALKAGEAASLSGRGLMDFNSATLTAVGRAQIRKLARHLRGDHAVTCEGYADYGADPSNEQLLSDERAAAVCRALREDGAKVRTRSIGYGPSRPAVTGGKSAQRSRNRRVVIVVDR